jgi:hypothetical protein
MRGFCFRTFLAAPAIMIAACGVADAQAVTKFDGTYNGVSNTASGGNRSCVPAIPVPRALTIKNGAAQWATGTTGDTTFQGNVTADGSFTARGSNGSIFTGRIDASGKVTGGFNGGGGCTIMSVWQK